MSERKVRVGSDSEYSDLKDRTAFVGMFDAHAAHLYDYCVRMLGDAAEAAGATRVTLIAAHMLGGRINQPDQLRAWMFALARRECLSESPTRKQPWIQTERSRPVNEVNGSAITEAETGEIARFEEPAAVGFQSEIRRAVRLAPSGLTLGRQRTDQYAEVLDLVERHDIAPSELPAILDISPERAQDLLAAAPVMTSRGAAHADIDAPIASLPASLWRETASVVFDAEQISYCRAIAADAGRLWADGFPSEPAAPVPPSQKKMAMTSVGLAAALLAPAALGAGLYAIFATSAAPPSVHRPQEYAIPPVSTAHVAPPLVTTPATEKPVRKHTRTHHARPKPSTIFSTTPVTHPQPTTPPTHKPPKTSPPVISGPPTGSPSPTKTSPSPGGTSPTPTP